MADAEDSTKKYAPLTDDLILDALRKDKGEAAELVSWQWDDFTKKGDNYACFVTSVKVLYKDNKHEVPEEVSYVAKIAHQFESSFTNIMNDVFQREGACFIEILPKINNALRELNLDGIRTAKGFCVSIELGKEVLMLEDLRVRDFKLFDRRRGMDVTHANLVLKELGRLHAASLVMEKKVLGCSLVDTWPILIEKWLEQENYGGMELFQKIMEAQMDTAALIMEKIPQYGNVVKWIRSIKPRGMEIFTGALERGSRFEVLTHGDCWNNNILFRYNEEGTPMEVMLLDLQGMRKASAAADLSYFLYSSFTGNIRQNNYKDFITTYYDSFSNVLQTAKLPLPFSQEELLQELRDKMTFGCVSGMILAPITLSEEQDVRGFLNLTGETVDEDNRERQKTVLRMSERSDGQLKDRFLAMFDEMVEAGIVSSDADADAGLPQ